MDNKDVPFAIHISLGVLTVITAIITGYYCKTSKRLMATNADEPDHHPHVSSGSYSLTINEQGLDEATLRSFPKLMYSKIAKFNNKDVVYNSSTTTSCTCCSICLADYKERDMLRVLPDCRHVFHVKCVDPWLRLLPTCPLCRT